MRIFGQPTRPSMSSRGGTSNRGGAAYRPMGVRNDPVTGAPILPGTQPPPWTARPRPGTAAGGTPDRLPTRPRIQTEISYALPDPSEAARKRYAEAMMAYVGKAAPHSSRYYGRYGGEATKDYIAAQIGAAPVYSVEKPKYIGRNYFGQWIKEPTEKDISPLLTYHYRSPELNRKIREAAR